MKTTNYHPADAKGLSQGFTRGFTLIELVLTISLMGFIGVGLVSKWDSSPTAVQNALIMVVDHIRYAQNRAMVTGQVHGFKTNSSTQYQIYQQVPGNLTVDPATLGALQPDLVQNFPGVSFQGNYQIEFNASGAPTMGAGLDITLSKGSVVRTFSINNNTGTVNLP